MTKKHFIALANVVRNLKPTREHPDDSWEDGYESGELSRWLKMRDALADFCQSQNSQFNRSRWLSYIAGECGPNGGSK